MWNTWSSATSRKEEFREAETLDGKFENDGGDINAWDRSTTSLLTGT